MLRGDFRLIDEPFVLIPAIDLRDGKCVRLHQGDYDKETIYSEDPVQIAKQFEDAGARLIHVVDLDGARAGEPLNLPVARKIADAVHIPCDFGGGIRDAHTARRVLEAGFRMFSVGTKALDESFALQIFGSFGTAAIADIGARDGQVAIKGWQEDSGISAVEFARKLESLGCKRIIFTDVTRDGALTGPNLESTAEVAKAVNIPVVASGGVSSLEDILQACKLMSCGVEGIIVGRAIYDGRVNLGEALSAVGEAVALAGSQHKA